MAIKVLTILNNFYKTNKKRQTNKNVKFFFFKYKILKSA